MISTPEADTAALDAALHLESTAGRVRVNADAVHAASMDVRNKTDGLVCRGCRSTVQLQYAMSASTSL
jgi:hypothetical protein